jgi:integrase
MVVEINSREIKTSSWPICLNKVRARPEGRKGNYVAHFDSNGSRRKKSLKTRRHEVARKAAIQLELQLESNSYVPTPSKKNISEAVEEYLKAKTVKGICKKTSAKYSRELAEFMEFCANNGIAKIQQINEPIFTAYRQFRASRNLINSDEALAEKTIFLSMMIVRGFVKWCAKRRYISSDPLVDLGLKKPAFRLQFCPTEEMTNAVLTAAPEHLAVLLYMLAFTGMRSGELQLLRPTDVDLAQNVIKVHTLKSKMTCIRPLRKIPIHPRLREILQIHGKPLFNTGFSYFFTAAPSKKYQDGGHEINTKHLNERLQSLVKSLGLSCGRANEGFVIHSFRHFFETVCINSGVPQRAVDAWLGHTGDRSMGAVYYRLNDQESQKQILKICF